VEKRDLKIYAEWISRIKRGNGKVEVINHGKNLIVDAGLGWLADYLQASGQPANMNYFGFGTSNTAEANDQTALVAELSGGGYARPQTTISNPSTYVVRHVGTLTGVDATIQEVGLFNAETGGTMFCRKVVGPFSLE